MRKGRKEGKRRSWGIGERGGGSVFVSTSLTAGQVGPLTSQSIWPHSGRDSGHAPAQNLLLFYTQPVWNKPKVCGSKCLDVSTYFFFG